jgi:putative transposase
MPRKVHDAKEIVAILRRIQMLVVHQPVKAAVRTANITEVTYYRWRKRYEGLSDDQVEWLIRLQGDNARLCRLVANLKLDKLILQEVSKEMLRNTVFRRQWVNHVKIRLNISERRVCRVLGQHRSTQRKIPKRPTRMRLNNTIPHLLPAPSLGT